MRLVSYLNQDPGGIDHERWGFVINDPDTGEEVVMDPVSATRAIGSDINLGTSGYQTWSPSFLDAEWPDTLVGQLERGALGMAELHDLESFVVQYVERTDATLADRAGRPIASVELVAPIPRPRLYWGLVTNSPSFVRNKPEVPHLNLVPIGHQRAQGAAIGHGQQIWMRQRHHDPVMSYNVELAVVIGTGGREIPLERAMEHVAGYTTVNDVAGSYYYNLVAEDGGKAYQLPQSHQDWFFQVTASWGGKIGDTLAPMGPYLVTKDEVGNPYDLLAHTAQSGRTRDRAHTSALLMGIERVIHWYSSFASLHPGDVIHFGTMGVDGLPIEAATVESSEPMVELDVEMERCGRLRNPVAVQNGEVDLCKHPAWSVRQEALQGSDRAPNRRWSVDQARHFYTAFGNSRVDADDAGLPVLDQPRFLLGPSSSLGRPGSLVEVPARSTELVVSIELAVVIGELSLGSARGDLDRMVAGFIPLLSFCDQSIQQEVVEPARAGEHNVPQIYGRWPDGFNVVGDWRTGQGPTRWWDRGMSMQIDGKTVRTTTNDYIAGPGELIEMINAITTLFPGDVITLGRSSAKLSVAAHQSVSVHGAIDGIGTVHTRTVALPTLSDRAGGPA